jgi:hypothetical protein
MMLASMRPHSIDLPLFVHVLGAMVLVGGLLVASVSVLAARGDTRLLRIGYFTLLAVCLPAYLVMRIGAEWTYAKEHIGDLKSDPTWVGIGYMTADAGALLLLIALVLGGFGVRRLPDGRTGLVRASLFIAVLLLAAYTVTVWAMGAKPS